MRVCRFEHQGVVRLGLYDEARVTSFAAGAKAHADATHERLAMPESENLVDYLPPAGPGAEAARKLAKWIDDTEGRQLGDAAIPIEQVRLRTPAPRPNKLFLLAGNYAEHIRESGGVAAERAATFPYVFMKPPSTTLTHPGQPVRIPAVSPHAIDWEVELAVVIGRAAKGVSEAEALGYVAGYTIVNDISNRRFRPNPDRVTREKDKFFDWLHGKWFDGFCPAGPCITSADAVPDPQSLALKLRLNGEIKQDATTAQQVFPVAAVIAFISSMVTLEPGDMISTGTPSGVGAASETFLAPGDVLEAEISSIGKLVSPVVAE